MHAYFGIGEMSALNSNTLPQFHIASSRLSRAKVSTLDEKLPSIFTTDDRNKDSSAVTIPAYCQSDLKNTLVAVCVDSCSIKSAAAANNMPLSTVKLHLNVLQTKLRVHNIKQMRFLFYDKDSQESSIHIMQDYVSSVLNVNCETGLAKRRAKFDNNSIIDRVNMTEEKVVGEEVNVVLSHHDDKAVPITKTGGGQIRSLSDVVSNNLDFFDFHPSLLDNYRVLVYMLDSKQCPLVLDADFYMEINRVKILPVEEIIAILKSHKEAKTFKVRKDAITEHSVESFRDVFQAQKQHRTESAVVKAGLVAAKEHLKNQRLEDRVCYLFFVN